MAKADALHAVSLKTDLNFQGEKLQVDNLVVRLDDSTLSGWLHVIDLADQKIRYELAVDHMNINHYLPPIVEQADVGGTDAGEGAPLAAETTTGDEKIELPLEMMRQLDIQGDFRINALTAREYDITDLLMSLKAANGDIAIKPLSLNLLEGRVDSSVGVNVQKDRPAYAMKLNVSQVQAGPVVNPMLEGIMGDKPVTMDGAVNLTTDVKTEGEALNQLKKAATGQIVLNMNQTRVDGFDPEYFMRKSVAEYIHSKGMALSKTIMGDYEPREVTVFDKIYSTVKLKDGKASTNDFIMDSKRVQVGAQGYADIIQNTLDVTSSVKLPRGKTAVEKVLDSPLYVRVHGPFGALEYDIDEKRMKKSTTDVLENEAKARLEEEKQKLKQEAEEKARKEVERSKEKLENKLKDKLKGLF
jgi:AsmA protein